MPGGCFSLLTIDTDAPSSPPLEPPKSYAPPQQPRYSVVGPLPGSRLALPANSASTTSNTTTSNARGADGAATDAVSSGLATALGQLLQQPLPAGSPSATAMQQQEAMRQQQEAMQQQHDAMRVGPIGACGAPHGRMAGVAADEASTPGPAPAHAERQQQRATSPLGRPSLPGPPLATASTAIGADTGAADPHATAAHAPAPAPSAQPPVAAAAAAGPPLEAIPTNWSRGKLIGQGAFGSVYLGRDNLTGKLFAVKQVLLTKDEHLSRQQAGHIHALEAEVAVLRRLKHPHIVQYIGTERTKEAFNIFLEYVAGGSIASTLTTFGALEETLVKIYTKQILKGLEYLHRKEIMHRDIKGANVLVDTEGVVKLADFGASKKIGKLASVKDPSVKGTPSWMAPEIIRREGHGRPADIWSLGCCVIEMATGKPPWSDLRDPFSIMHRSGVMGETPRLPPDSQMPYGPWSADARDFLTRCFNHIPNQRPNATQLLRHPWLTGVVVPVVGQPAPMPVPAPAPMPAAPAPMPAAATAPVPGAAESLPGPRMQPATQGSGVTAAAAPVGPSHEETRLGEVAMQQQKVAAAVATVGALPAAAPPAATRGGQEQQQQQQQRMWGDTTLDAAVDAELRRMAAAADDLGPADSDEALPNMASVRASLLLQQTLGGRAAVGGGGGGGGLTLDFNPMQDPSMALAAGPQTQRFLEALRQQQQKQQHLAPLQEDGHEPAGSSGRGVAQFGPCGADAAHAPQPRQGSAGVEVEEEEDFGMADSLVVVRAEARPSPAAGLAAAAMPAATGGAAAAAGKPKVVVPPLPLLTLLGKREEQQQLPGAAQHAAAAGGPGLPQFAGSLAAGKLAGMGAPAAPQHGGKHQQWLDELIGEMNSKRQEQAAQRAEHAQQQGRLA